MQKKLKTLLEKVLTHKLIHETDPQLRPVVIIIFTRGVRTCVRPHFSKSRKRN